MARKLKRFATGGDAVTGSRYSRKTDDIEKDYQKALKRGKDADVAKAKRDQRLADARDDLAKWRGEDRSETRAAERAAERNLTMTRRYGAASAPKVLEAEASKPLDVGPIDSSKLLAPEVKKPVVSRSRTRAPASPPAAARAPAPPAAARAPASPAKLPEWVSRRGIRDYISPTPAARAPALPKPKEEIAARVGTRPPLQSLVATNIAGRKRDLSPEQLRKLEEARQRSGTRTSGFAEGGKIDGCAVRGKTRAKRTK